MSTELVELTPTQLLDDPSFPALFREYADECALAGLPPPNPARELYAALERTGMVYALGVCQGEELVGFLVLLVSVNPHYGVPLGAVESYFVAKAARSTGAGLELRAAAERLAKDKGAVAMLVSAPADGALCRVMARSKGYQRTNEVFCKVLA